MRRAAAMQQKMGAILVLIVVILTVAANWTLGEIKSKFHASLKSDLQAVLMITSEALRNWKELSKERLKRYIYIMERDHLILHFVKSGLTEHKTLVQHPMQQKIRNMLTPVMRENRYQGFFIISTDFINLASSRDGNLGQKSLISEGVLARVVEGETLLSLPIRSDVPLPDAEGKLRSGQPTMFILGPIREHTGDEKSAIVGILAFRIAPARVFAQIANPGRLMETGETYLFDRQGRMLSESRFLDYLYETGRLPAGASAILNIELRSPAGDLTTGYKSLAPRQQQPYTKAVAFAISGNNGYDIHGYNGYRGVPVAGAWEWDYEVGVGLTTEIDVAEAYHAYYITRQLVLGSLIAISLFAVSVIVIFVKSRQRELRQARVIAESMTTEAAKANQALQSELMVNEALANILRKVINAVSEKEVLDAVLQTLSPLEFLGFKNVGGGFLVGESGQSLTMITAHNLDKPLLTSCAEVKFGHCFCGRAAETGEIQHVSCIDDRHEIRFDGMKPHGHYSVPFMIDSKVAGVIVLYLKHGTALRQDCVALLNAIADIIAGAIKRIRAEKTTQQNERLASLGSMVAGIAHEINSPVGTAVTNVSELVEKTAMFQRKYKSGGIRKSELDSFLQDAQDFSCMAQENLLRAAELVHSFKLVAVDQSSEEEWEFNLLEHINATITTLYHEFKRTEISIQVDCPEGLVITSFPGAFSQIITNLAHNSRIHGFDNGQSAGEIIIAAKQHPDMRCLIINYSDNGKGMNEEQQQKIFAPFYTTKRNQGGSGLGMHIVYNLVTQTLGGTIEVESVLGQGVCFHMAIPITMHAKL